jgi:hypothetical protein
MRFRTHLLVTAIAAVAILSAGLPVDAGRDARPLTGTLSGVVDFLPAPECPVGLKTVSDATGTFSHLGRTTMHSEHCTPAGDFIFGGIMTLTAANGDEITINYNGEAPFPTPTTTVIHIAGDALIVDGTGRFEDATGGQLDGDWDTFNYTADVQFPGFDPDTGMPIPGPWDATWRFGPMTIGY